MPTDVTTPAYSRDAQTQMFMDWAIHAPPPTYEQEIEYEEAFHTAIVRRVGERGFGQIAQSHPHTPSGYLTVDE